MWTILLLVVAAIFAFPLIAMLVAPLRQPGLPPPRGLEFIPKNPSLRSFSEAFALVPLARAIGNSLLVAFIAVPITIVTASWAGLAMTLMSGWRRRLLIGALLVLALVPVTAVWIPRFVLFDALELIGTYVPLIAPALMGGSPLFVLLYFVALRRIPPELFEAARMEGVGPLRIWWSVALPLVRPTTAAIALLALVLFWSNFIDPLLYLRSEKQLTAPPMLHQLELLGPTNWPVFLAGALVVTFPVVLAFLFAQRFLSNSERKAGFVRFSAVCAFAILAAGCGRSGSKDRSTQTIRFQAFGDPAELIAYRELIAAFERANPDVKIEFIPVGKQKDHMTKLTTGFSGGDPPDLFLINFRRFGQFAEKNVLEQLGPRMAERGHVKEEDLYEQATEAFRYNGTLTCMPQNVSSLVVYYNRRLFEAAGIKLPTANWTWPEAVRAAQKLTRDTDGDRRIDQYGIGFEPSLIRVAPIVWQMNGEIVDDLRRPTKFALRELRARKALEFVRDLYIQYRIVPPLAEAKSEDHESRFARGGLGMILHSRRYTATLRSVPNLDWDVAPLPYFLTPATVLHSDAYCVAKESARKEATYRFIEFALSPEGATIIAKSGRTVPTLKSVAESAAFLDPTLPPKSARVFLDSIPHIRRTPNIAQWNEIETRVDPVIEEWFYSNDPNVESVGAELDAAVQGLFPSPK